MLLGIPPKPKIEWLLYILELLGILNPYIHFLIMQWIKRPLHSSKGIAFYVVKGVYPRVLVCVYAYEIIN